VQPAEVHAGVEAEKVHVEVRAEISRRASEPRENAAEVRAEIGWRSSRPTEVHVKVETR
jgi:hypothetical protein